MKFLHESHRGRNTCPSLKQLSELLTRAIADFDNTFIIVDALDECPEQDGVRQAFLDELRFPRLNVNLLATSRPVERLRDDMEADATLEIGASDTDVRKYLEGQMNHDRRLARLVGPDPSLKELIIRTIVKNANGMYVYEHLLSFPIFILPTATRHQSVKLSTECPRLINSRPFISNQFFYAMFSQASLVANLCQ